MQRSIIALLLIFSCPLIASAQVDVKDPWVRATVPQQKNTGAFMRLTAPQGARLIEVRSPAADLVEIHETTMVDNVMKMRAVPGIELPAGKAVELKPGGYHVMLINLKSQIKEGETVPITLVFENKDKKRDTLDLKVPARPLNTAADSHNQMKH